MRHVDQASYRSATMQPGLTLKLIFWGLLWYNQGKKLKIEIETPKMLSNGHISDNTHFYLCYKSQFDRKNIFHNMPDGQKSLKNLENRQNCKLQKWSQTFRNVMERISIYEKGLNSNENSKFFYSEWSLGKNLRIKHFSKFKKFSQKFRNVMKHISIYVRVSKLIKNFFPSFISSVYHRVSSMMYGSRFRQRRCVNRWWGCLRLHRCRWWVWSPIRASPGWCKDEDVSFLMHRWKCYFWRHLQLSIFRVTLLKDNFNFSQNLNSCSFNFHCKKIYIFFMLQHTIKLLVFHSTSHRDSAEINIWCTFLSSTQITWLQSFI